MTISFDGPRVLWLIASNEVIDKERTMVSMKSAKLSGDRGFTRFAAAASAAEYLPAAREKELGLLSQQGDLRARNKLVHAHLRLVIKVAAGFVNYGHPLAELVAAGNVGLLEGAQRFDPGMDNRFSTYVTWWIRAEVMNYVLKNASTVKVPSTKEAKSLFYKGAKARKELESKGMTESEIMASLSRRFKLPVADVENLMLAHRPATSLSAPVSVHDDSGATLSDMLVDEGPSQEDILVKSDEHDLNVRRLNAVLEKLGERECDVFRARRLMDDPMTLEALAARYSVSKERIRQIEVKAFEKVRTAMLSKAA